MRTWKRKVSQLQCFDIVTLKIRRLTIAWSNPSH
jgi:hypothetical protein